MPTDTDTLVPLHAYRRQRNQNRGYKSNDTNQEFVYLGRDYTYRGPNGVFVSLKGDGGTATPREVGPN